MADFAFKPGAGKAKDSIRRSKDGRPYAMGPKSKEAREEYFHTQGMQGAEANWSARDIYDHIVDHNIHPDDAKHVRNGFKDYHGLRYDDPRYIENNDFETN